MASPIGKLSQLVPQCGDAVALAGFWQDVLALEASTGDADWQTLEWEPVGRLSFHSVQGYRPPRWPGEAGEMQAHFDLLVDDLVAQDRRVLDAGAVALTEVLDPGPKAWRVYADPAGHPFCLASVPE